MKQVNESLSVMKAILQSSAAREENLIANIRDVVSKEISRSHSATPSASISIHQQQQQDVMTQVEGFISVGRFDEAFQYALSANSLAIVVSTCELINPMQVFSQTPCPLSQTVLLSLIQQLSHNLEEKTEIKHKYLEEAVMNLNSRDQNVKRHLKMILNTLQKNLQDFIQHNPNQKITRSMKMLQMATHSLVNEAS